MKHPADQWDDLPDPESFSMSQLNPVFPENISFAGADHSAEIELPPDPLHKFDYEVRHRPKAPHWPAPFQGKLRLTNGSQKVFYGVSVNSLLDQMRSDIECRPSN